MENVSRYLILLLVMLNIGMFIGNFIRNENWLFVACAVMTALLVMFIYYSKGE